ncbi:hypothetical protein IAI10_23085 [Clostridium sp. 19966]|uniref:hypothetical protein n=1 Tax=Clostridium sp. 19966 TaxID=2768166 RepID=UPI0028DD6F6C|nr:hypothetical protein [Clostridium sp. 19966]MDT8719534.1 hypothetical protein [Clostridium sp. 19966]
MNKKYKCLIVLFLVISFCAININTTAYAVGDKSVLDGNNANTGENSNSGGSNNKPSIPKPKPPTTEQWYDKILWDKVNSSISWIDDSNRLVITDNQATKNRESTVSKDWKWTFSYGESEGNITQTLGERFDKQQITFIAPRNGYYYITSTPRVTETTYFYNRIVTTKYWLKEDEDGIYMVARFISREGEVPSKTIVKQEDILQSYLMKDFKIYLRQGEKFDPSPIKKIISETTDIDTTSSLVK